LDISHLTMRFAATDQARSVRDRALSVRETGLHLQFVSVEGPWVLPT